MTSRNRIIQIACDFSVIGLIGIIFLLVNSYVEPNIRGFHCNDNDIFYPLKPDIVPAYAVALFGIVGTFICIILIECINKFNKVNFKTIIISAYHGIALFLFGVVSTLLLTEICKRWIGRLRPYFIAACNPIIENFNCTLNGAPIFNYIDTSGSFCRGKPSDIKEARLSFPSGHSSTSFYTMIFLIIYIQARVSTLKFRYMKVLVQLTAFIAAYVTSISRVRDYHHRGSDVIAGAILGTTVAIFLTLVSGRVIWLYGRQKALYDFDLVSNKGSETETVEI